MRPTAAEATGEHRLVSGGAQVTRRLRRLFVPLLVVIALAAAAFTLVATEKYGVGASPDSVAYLSAARSLRSGSLATYSGDPYIIWPPGLPALLAAIPGDPLVVARFLDALCLAALALLVGLWVKQASGPLVGLAAAALAATSIPLLYVYSFLWSEPLFILLTTASLFCLAKYRVRPSMRLLLSAAVLAGVAGLTRYSGTVLIAIGAALLLMDATRSLRSRLKSVLLFGLIGAAPLVAWLLRNWVVARTLTGRQPPQTPLSAQLHGAWGTALAWTSLHVPLTADLSPVQHLAQGLMVIAVLGLLGWFAWSRRRTLFSRATLADSSFWMATVFAAGYVVLLIYTAATSKLDLLGDRLLSPVYPSLLVACLIAAHYAWQRWRLRYSRPRLGTWLLLIAVLVVACLTLPNRALEVRSRLATDVHNGAGGYTKDYWMRSATMAHVRSWGPGVVYSNAPDLIYLRTGRSAKFFPTRAQGIDRWLQRTRTERIVLVRLGSGDNRPLLYTFDQLLRYLPDPTVTRYSDGIVARSTDPVLSGRSDPR